MINLPYNVPSDARTAWRAIAAMVRERSTRGPINAVAEEMIVIIQQRRQAGEWPTGVPVESIAVLLVGFALLIACRRRVANPQTGGPDHGCVSLLKRHQQRQLLLELAYVLEEAGEMCTASEIRTDPLGWAR